MYKIDEKTDFSSLNGLQLIQVCISTHQIILNFTNDFSLSIYCDLVFSDGANKVYIKDNSYIRDSKVLIVLIDKVIDDVHVDDEQSLVLSFTSGYSLKLVDVSPNFESYELNSKSLNLIV